MQIKEMHMLHNNNKHLEIILLQWRFALFSSIYTLFFDSRTNLNHTTVKKSDIYIAYDKPIKLCKGESSFINK